LKCAFYSSASHNPVPIAHHDNLTESHKTHNHDHHEHEHHDHDHDHEHYPDPYGEYFPKEGPYGFLFGEIVKPGEKRQWQSWESTYYVGAAGVLLVFLGGMVFSGENSEDIHVWAKKERERRKSSE